MDGSWLRTNFRPDSGGEVKVAEIPSRDSSNVVAFLFKFKSWLLCGYIVASEWLFDIALREKGKEIKCGG